MKKLLSKLQHPHYGAAILVNMDRNVRGANGRRTVVHFKFPGLMGSPSEVYWFTPGQLWSAILTGRLPERRPKSCS